jgi:hypothetical protein
MSSKEEKEVIERISAMTGVADRESSIMVHTPLHSVASPTERHEMSHYTHNGACAIACVATDATIVEWDRPCEER